MPSTFFGLTIASSGLNAAQVALNTTANNISNVQTPGYTRQQANRVAGDAIRTYTKYGSMGTGVTTVSIKQVRNQYYDAKYWFNEPYVGLYETRLDYLKQIENYFLDDGESSKGFNHILNTLFNSVDTLKNEAGDPNVRQQFIADAQKLATYFNGVSAGLSQIQNNANEEIKSTVQNINAIAEKIALLNKQINVIEVQGGYANELRDQRALLVDELSKIVPIEVEETLVQNTNNPDNPLGGTYYTVKIGGQRLVDTYDYYTLECVARENKVSQSDIEGLYDIKWAQTGNTFNAGGSHMSGTLKALFDIRDGNNNENFKGLIADTDGTTITVTHASITSVATMSMPEEGELTINGRKYRYSGFDYETDADGKVTSYTFKMVDALSADEMARAKGGTVAIGTSIDSMGIPYYMAQMNEYLRSFCSMFNDILKKGEDLNGKATDYYAFFTGKDPISGEEYVFNGMQKDDATGITSSGSAVDDYYKMTAANICVSSICIKDPNLLGATAKKVDSSGVDTYDLMESLALLKKDTVFFRGGTAIGFLQCMIADLSIDTQESQIFYENYTNVANTIENQRMSISGVDEDEEALDLIKFQNAYNLSSKMISIMTEIYDRLILETGV